MEIVPILPYHLKMKTIQFLDEECSIKVDHYRASKNPAIFLFSNSGPVGTASVDLPDYNLKRGEILIKDYSENQGVAQAIQNAGLAQEIARTRAGHAVNGVSVMKITDPELLEACYPKEKTVPTKRVKKIKKEQGPDMA